jgi:hypothetical protein
MYKPEIPDKERRNLRKTYEAFRMDCRSFRGQWALLFSAGADRIKA